MPRDKTDEVSDTTMTPKDQKLVPKKIERLLQAALLHAK